MHFVFDPFAVSLLCHDDDVLRNFAILFENLTVDVVVWEEKEGVEIGTYLFAESRNPPFDIVIKIVSFRQITSHHVQSSDVVGYPKTQNPG